MNIETSAARLFHQQFLNIVQQQQKKERLHLQITAKETAGASTIPSVVLASNPANWDDTWFANYE